jgi:hypothetical protein
MPSLRGLEAAEAVVDGAVLAGVLVEGCAGVGVELVLVEEAVEGVPAGGIVASVPAVPVTLLLEPRFDGVTAMWTLEAV